MCYRKFGKYKESYQSLLESPLSPLSRNTLYIYIYIYCISFQSFFCGHVCVVYMYRCVLRLALTHHNFLRPEFQSHPWEVEYEVQPGRPESTPLQRCMVMLMRSHVPRFYSRNHTLLSCLGVSEGLRIHPYQKPRVDCILGKCFFLLGSPCYSFPFTVWQHGNT